MAGNYEKTLYKLVRHVSGKKKNDCVLVIPCAESDSAFAGRHLAVLEKQTTDKFDVLIISGKPLKFKTKVNVLYFRENYPLGSSGGFGLGQVLGYTLGYEYVMATDVGVTPCSNDVIETLKRRAAAEQKLVVPLSMGLKEEIGNPEQYGICPRKVLEEDGFLFFRLYKGGEDGEYMNRLIMDGKFVVERTVGIQHEVLSPDIIAVLKSRGNKHIYYKKSNVLNHITLANITVQGGLMGANGALRTSKLCSHNNSAGNKIHKEALSSSNIHSFTASTSVSFRWDLLVRNAGSQAVNIGPSSISTGSSGVVGTNLNRLNIDTSQAQQYTFSGQIAVATDYIVLEGFTVEVLPRA